MGWELQSIPAPCLVLVGCICTSQWQRERVFGGVLELLTTHTPKSVPILQLESALQPSLTPGCACSCHPMGSHWVPTGLLCFGELLELPLLTPLAVHGLGSVFLMAISAASMANTSWGVACKTENCILPCAVVSLINTFI